MKIKISCVSSKFRKARKFTEVFSPTSFFSRGLIKLNFPFKQHSYGKNIDIGLASAEYDYQAFTSTVFERMTKYKGKRLCAKINLISATQYHLPSGFEHK